MGKMTLKNTTFPSENIQSFLNGYLEELKQGLNNFDSKSLAQATQFIEETLKNKKKIYVAGNGGSAAIANHLCCDWTKGTFHPEKPTLKTFSFSTNTPLLTAISNDLGYEKVFSTQVEFYGEAGDLLILISSSGNSPNVLEAAKKAHDKKMTVISFTGFEGGGLKKISDVHLHIPVANYGIVEDSHQILMHVIAQYLTQKFKATQKPQ